MRRNINMFEFISLNTPKGLRHLKECGTAIPIGNLHRTFNSVTVHNKKSGWEPQKSTAKGERPNHSPTATHSRILSRGQLIFLTIPAVMMNLSRVTLNLI